MEVTKDTRNELFKRQELSLELESEKNPGFAEVRKQIAEKVGKPEENIDVLRVKGNFGKRKFNVEAYVYDSKEDLEKMKKLAMTQKQRKEEVKVKEEGEKAKVEEEKKKKEEAEKSEEKPAEASTAHVEEKEPKEEPENKPTEAPVEKRPEEEKKAVEEEKEKEKKKEESKE